MQAYGPRYMSVYVTTNYICTEMFKGPYGEVSS